MRHSSIFPDAPAPDHRLDRDPPADPRAPAGASAPLEHGQQLPRPLLVAPARALHARPLVSLVRARPLRPPVRTRETARHPRRTARVDMFVARRRPARRPPRARRPAAPRPARRRPRRRRRACARAPAPRARGWARAGRPRRRGSASSSASPPASLVVVVAVAGVGAVGDACGSAARCARRPGTEAQKARDWPASRAVARAASVGVRSEEVGGRAERRAERIVGRGWQRIRCVLGGRVERSASSGIGVRSAVIVGGMAGWWLDRRAGRGGVEWSGERRARGWWDQTHKSPL